MLSEMTEVLVVERLFQAVRETDWCRAECYAGLVVSKWRQNS